jgi:long-subunit fatty acid transport protein
LAYKLDRGEVEVDVSYHGASDPYAIYQSAVTGTQTILTGGVPTTTTPSMAPLEDEWHSVTNFAVGGNYRLNERVRMHAGFYTDASPVSDPASSFFRKVDLTGSLGLGYSSGKSDPLTVTDAATGISSETRLTVNSLRAAYAISFTF